VRDLNIGTIKEILLLMEPGTLDTTLEPGLDFDPETGTWFPFLLVLVIRPLTGKDLSVDKEPALRFIGDVIIF